MASCADLSAMKEADDLMQRKEGEKEDKYALIIDGKALKQYLPPKVSSLGHSLVVFANKYV